MLKIDIKGKIPSSYYAKQDIQKTADLIFEKLGVAGEFGAEIIFASEDEIRELNEKYRHINKETDVLSFPQQAVDGSRWNILGSIVICGKIANDRGEKLDDLVKHGFLHLLGYDHETDDAKWGIAAKKINCNL